jgi:hypothetical protein
LSAFQCLLAGEYVREGASPARASVVERFELDRTGTWLRFAASKQNGDRFTFWLQGEGRRYIFQEGAGEAVEYRHGATGEAAMPSILEWDGLTPKPAGPDRMTYLGHTYRFFRPSGATALPPPRLRVVTLRPDMWVGTAHNLRQKDDTRRYDGSEYEFVPLTAQDYRDMAAAGVTCVNVDRMQLPWAHDLGLFYWGKGGNELPFLEMVYRPQYLGPTIFIDEPAVHTRDSILRPRFEIDPGYRKRISAQLAYGEFTKYFEHALKEGAHKTLVRALSTRPDVDLGQMEFIQQNLYTWETMPSTALYQLSRDARVPQAFVFEPPGRIGSRRTLPEFNMTYGTQIPPGNPRHLTDILFGFARGAARVTGKEWGVSIYGAVEQADAPYWLTRAYDMGATRFLFWDNSQLAAVPYREVLALARHLKAHSAQNPRPSLERLRSAAEVAVVFPPGYNLGHVQMGKGNLWGVGELNLERVNRAGVKYRDVMSALFTEIEWLLKTGRAFDAMWDLADRQPTGYREVIRIREDAKVEPRAHTPDRAQGVPPKLQLDVTLSGLRMNARAHVTETDSPVWYTYGADTTGEYRNAKVLIELYGPDEEDHRVLLPSGLRPLDQTVVELTRSGRYRLRAATVDSAGRATVVWKEFTAAP